jgi:hypothetical protein
MNSNSGVTVFARCVVATICCSTSNSICVAHDVHEFLKVGFNDGRPDRALFGYSVSLDGNRALIGAPGMAEGQQSSGAAFLMERNDQGAWQQVAKFVSDNPAPFGDFGRSVSLSDSWAIIGDYRNSPNLPGEAHVFGYDGASHWNRVMTLKASDTTGPDGFGHSVYIDANLAIIGALGSSSLDDFTGAAYVFENDGLGNWQQIAKLTADDGHENATFGSAVAISGNKVVVGAPGNEHAGRLSGAAYIFQRSEVGNWQQVAKLTASDAAAGSNFGSSVAIDGNRAIVGSEWRDSSIVEFAGAAYIFDETEAGNWAEAAKLTLAAPEEFGRFGSSVDIEGNVAVVGAYGVESHTGAAYLYRRSPVGDWNQIARLTASDAMEGDALGWSASLSGNTVLVGAYRSNTVDDLAGVAYLFAVPEPNIPMMLLILLLRGRSERLHRRRGGNFWK